MACGLKFRAKRVSLHVSVRATEGSELSALLEAEAVPSALLKTVKASIRLIANTDKQNASVPLVLV